MVLTWGVAVRDDTDAEAKKSSLGLRFLVPEFVCSGGEKKELIETSLLGPSKGGWLGVLGWWVI